jgi:cryptochrome
LFIRFAFFASAPTAVAAFSRQAARRSFQHQRTLCSTSLSVTMSNKESKVVIHWFRNGLRFHDNPCLADACENGNPQNLIPLAVIDPEAPFAQTSGHRAGCIRANFILEALQEIDTKLKGMGSQLVVIVGDPVKVIPEVVAAVKASALYYEQDPAAPVRQADALILEAVRQRLEKQKGEKHNACDIKGYGTHSLHSMETYLAKCTGHTAPATYGGFTKIFQAMKVPKEVDDVNQVPQLPEGVLELLQKAFGDNLGIPSLERLGYDKKDLKNRKKGGLDFQGGEDAGVALLNTMMKRSKWVATFEKPKTSPNALSVDTTGLSAYVKHGCVSPRRFYHELSKVYAKFNPKEISKPPVSLHGQLMWRDYNYLVGYSTPNFDKMIDNPLARQIPWDDDPALLDAWKNSKTGYPHIDAIMTQLRETGWIHHLARHSVACFLTRGDLWQSWEQGAAVFEDSLIDADWSVNNFNWQWLSCTAHFYQYFRCYSPVAFGKKTDKNGDYIRKWLPMFKDFPAKYIYEPWDAPIAVQKKFGVIVGDNYPDPIVDHTTTSKDNMGRMKAAYAAQKNGEPMPALPPRAETSDNAPSSKRQKT